MKTRIPTLRTIARRIVIRHNAVTRGSLSGGFLLFNRNNGMGGAWYSAGTRLGTDGSMLRVDVGRKALTIAEVESILAGSDAAE